jgi:hypothetical protein
LKRRRYIRVNGVKAKSKTAETCTPAKKSPDGSSVIVMDLSFKYLGRHLDFGGSFLYMHRRMKTNHVVQVEGGSSP